MYEQIRNLNVGIFQQAQTRGRKLEEANKMKSMFLTADQELRLQGCLLFDKAHERGFAGEGFWKFFTSAGQHVAAWGEFEEAEFQDASSKSAWRPLFGANLRPSHSCALVLAVPQKADTRCS